MLPEFQANVFDNKEILYLTYIIKSHLFPNIWMPFCNLEFKKKKKVEFKSTLFKLLIGNICKLKMI